MKVDDIFRSIKLDDAIPNVKEASDELNWLWKDIEKDVERLNEMKKRLFYKRDEFNRLCKEKLDNFNWVCNLSYMREMFTKDFYGETDISKNSQLLSCLVANYFPEWMWSDLEFLRVEGYNYGEEWWVYFIWSPKEVGDYKPVFQISIPNPDNIPVGRRGGEKEVGDEWDDLIHADHKTVVSVSSEADGMSYANWVASGYMNSEIMDGIDKWATNFINTSRKLGNDNC